MIVLYALAMILLVIWLVVVLTHLVLGGAIHVLLLAALVLFIIGFVRRARTA